MLECVAADKARCLCFQQLYQSTAEYLEIFRARVDVYKLTGKGIPGKVGAIAKNIANETELNDPNLNKEILTIENEKPTF